jgi:hypothetical protein
MKMTTSLAMMRSQGRQHIPRQDRLITARELQKLC